MDTIDKRRCVIFCASPEFYLPKLRADDYIIACDGGYERAQASGIAPDLILGDFDSYKGELPDDIPIVRAPVEKDDTDTMLAIKLALQKGYREFLLLGATGGRMDHLLANISAAVYIAKRGGNCKIVDKYCAIHVVNNGALKLCGIKGQTVSVLAYSDVAKGVTLTGMKYRLNDAEISNAFPLGVSNVAQEDECGVSVAEGTLLVIESGFAH